MFLVDPVNEIVGIMAWHHTETRVSSTQFANNNTYLTSAIDDIKVAMTNVEVKATIIRSVKSSTLKKKDKYPTNIKRKVGAIGEKQIIKSG